MILMVSGEAAFPGIYVPQKSKTVGLTAVWLARAEAQVPVQSPALWSEWSLWKEKKEIQSCCGP